MQSSLRPCFRHSLALNHITRCRWSYRNLATTVTSETAPVTLRRSYLYVPSSSDRMLEKTKTSTSDVFIYDLEDSISPVPSDKANARERLREFLRVGWFLDLTVLLILTMGDSVGFRRKILLQTMNGSACASMTLAHRTSRKT